MMEYSSFSAKSPSEISDYLSLKGGIPESICLKFEEEEIDGTAFLDLTESDIKAICQKLGPTKKIYRLIAEIKGNSSSTIPVTSSDFGSSPPWPCMSSPTSQIPTISNKDCSFSMDTFTPSPMSPKGLFSPESDDCSSVISSVSSSLKVFQIPDKWRPSIMECINASSEAEARKLLSPSIRNEIVRDLVTQMYSFWPQPNRTNCKLVANKLIQTYGFMRDEGEGISGYGSWERKIIDRVHNTRGTKRKATSMCEGTPEVKRGRPKLSSVLCRYPPIVAKEVDEITISRHVHLIKKEMERENPRKQILLPIMEETYYSRREMILSQENVVTIPTILETYPCLTLFPVIQQEIDLVLKKRNVANSAIQVWLTGWAPAIVDFVKTIKTKGTMNAYQKTTEMYKDDEESLEKIALSVIVQLLCKKSTTNSLTYIYDEFQMTDNPTEVAKNSKKPTPWFGGFMNGINEPTYYVFIEGEVVANIKKFSKALVVWFISHYIYNLEYCKEIKEVAQFIQEFVFSLPCKQKKGATYLSVTTGIKNFFEL